MGKGEFRRRKSRHTHDTSRVTNKSASSRDRIENTIDPQPGIGDGKWPSSALPQAPQTTKRQTWKRRMNM